MTSCALSLKRQSSPLHIKVCGFRKNSEAVRKRHQIGFNDLSGKPKTATVQRPRTNCPELSGTLLAEDKVVALLFQQVQREHHGLMKLALSVDQIDQRVRVQQIIRDRTSPYRPSKSSPGQTLPSDVRVRLETLGSNAQQRLGGPPCDQVVEKNAPRQGLLRRHVAHRYLVPYLWPLRL
jgi:hypothetical protein